MTPPTGTRRQSPTPSEPAANVAVDEDISRSDNESGGEKPVREKLRDTTIAGTRGRLHKKRSLEEVEADDANEEDVDGDHKPDTRHVRKRSREAVPGADVDVEVPRNGAGDVRSATPDAAALQRADEEMSGGLTSPKNKRTRDQVLSEAEDASADADGAPAISTPSEERKTKRARDSGSPQPSGETTAPAKIAPTSSFANASATSPFGSLVGAKPAFTDGKGLPQTSDEKFKSSGFGAFASASASPFGAAAGPPKAASPFGATAGSTSPWAAKPATPATQPSAFAAAGSSIGSGFGNTSTSSGFGGLGSSSLGGGFGGASALSGFGAVSGGSKLSAFAGGSGPTIQGLSSKPAKAFGASDDTDEEEEGGETDEDAHADDSGAKSPPHLEGDGKKDKRFYEQHIETGEEGETTMFQQRAKLYHYVQEEKKWVERGSGVLKLNISDPEDSPRDLESGRVKLMDAPAEGGDEEDSDGSDDSDNEESGKNSVHARLLLRADGSQRVVLNSPIRKGLKFGDETEPTSQNILFMGWLAGAGEGDAGLATLQVKMNSERAKALWALVRELQQKL